MTDEGEIAQIAEQVSQKVVSRLFLILGVNASDEKELIKLQKDLAHLRGWRESMEIVRSRSLATAVGFVVTALLGYALFFISKH
jgi:hypothetical protein